MTRRLTDVTRLVARLWAADAPLTGAALLMVVALAAFVAGLWLDPRIITGAPAWLKPAKFAVSTTIYMITVAWTFTYLSDWTATRRIVGRTTAVVLILEVAIIVVQAWRGTTSHFNAATWFDLVLFSIMGVAIVAQTVVSVALAAALWRQAFHDRALGWALRLGMTITILGAASGGLMTRPTEDQLADFRATARMAVVGSHTVGAPDGGPGVPGTGWSTAHGDLRVPHFLGLHAVQALPLILVLLGRRRWTETTRVRLLLVTAASYGALFVILLWQALRGQSVIDPDGATLAVVGVWLLLTVAGAWGATTRREIMPVHGATT
jgi:hypothetical protein